MKKLLVFIAVAAIAAGGWLAYTRQHDESTAENRPQASKKSTDFKKTRSLTDPASLWVIANKQRPLQPASYEPEDLVTPDVPLRLSRGSEEMQLRKAAAEALEKLFAAGEADNHKLMLSSAYRSYAYQKNLYNYYVSVQGRDVADTQSARPGYSEHQTGLAADIGPAAGSCVVEECFGNTPEGRWVAAHAHEYGFVIRYQEGKQTTTGYIYEPWHLRYVGTDLSQKLHEAGNPTLEDYFGLGSASNYKQ
jgi:D-alanyl-D-alanine carboxypeptidase